MEDIQHDGEGYDYHHGRFSVHSQNPDKKLNSLDDRVDSGLGSLGSLGYMSGELNNLSIDSAITEEKETTEADVPQSNLGSTSLEKSFSKLDIGSFTKSSDQCDSGNLDHDQDFSGQYNSPYSENWISPAFSPEQILDIFRGDEDGDNHLHLSIIHSLSEVTMQIIGLAPDQEWLDQPNNMQQTALHLAVITRQNLVVRRLICAGASVDVRDAMGNTPLHNACRLGYEEIVRTLSTPVKYEETLQNRYKIPFQKLPQDLELRNYEGLTCLHLAALGGHHHVIRLLLSAGANVNAPEGKSGRTILHFAADWGNMSMLKFLLSRHDTNIDARTYGGLTPILLAYGRQNSEIVEELISRGAMCETLSLSDDSDDASDEEMAEVSTPNKPFGALPREYQHSYR